MAANLGWCAAFVTMAVLAVGVPGPLSVAGMPLWIGLAVVYAVKAWEER
jgi:hypothetical protein